MSCDTHIYTNHEEQIAENLKRTPKPAPKLVIKGEKRDDIMDFKYSDLQIIGYYPDKSIQAPGSIIKILYFIYYMGLFRGLTVVLVGFLLYPF